MHLTDVCGAGGAAGGGGRRGGRGREAAGGAAADGRRSGEQVAPAALPQGTIHRVDPDFGSTLTVSNRDSHSNCWVNWKIMGRPCEFQVIPGVSSALQHERAILPESRSRPPDLGSARPRGQGGVKNMVKTVGDSQIAPPKPYGKSEQDAQGGSHTATP